MFKIAIKTTQNIPLFFIPASVGERIFAFVIDKFINIGYISFLLLIFEESNIYSFYSKLDYWEKISVIIILTTPVSLYSLICESLMNGQTFGKKAMKIRVLKIDGYQASFYDYFIRWIFGLLELNLVFIGIFSIIISKYSQRLGDLVAGTAVVSLKNKTNISHSILVDIEEKYTPYFSQNQIFLFSENDIQIIKKYYDQAISKNNISVLEKICKKIEDVSGSKKKDISSKEFVQRFLKDYSFYNIK